MRVIFDTVTPEGEALQVALLRYQDELREHLVDQTLAPGVREHMARRLKQVERLLQIFFP